MKALFATLLFALALSAGCGGAPRPPAAKTVTVEALSPRGLTTYPFDFTWKTNAGPAAVCRVSVFDVAERPVYRRETRQRQLAAPPELPRQAGSRLLWRVTILGDDGNVVAQTGLVGFTVK